MTSNWLSIIAYLALALGLLSAVIILVDIASGHRQRMAIMNLVWPISGLYFGPVGLWAYWRFGRRRQGAPDKPRQARSKPAGQKKPFWQKVFVSTTHCGAGCTVGDTIGETVVFLTGLIILGSSLLTVYAVDFALAYVAGVIFQFLAIAPMRHLRPAEGLKTAVKADTLSLIAFEVGMFGWMAVTRLLLFQPALEPNDPVYWFMMQIAMIVGFLTSYPANWFLVKRGIKEAM
jgi:hypothetical protein